MDILEKLFQHLGQLDSRLHDRYMTLDSKLAHVKERVEK